MAKKKGRWTRPAALTALRQLLEQDDVETRHGDADGVISAFLRDNGEPALARAYDAALQGCFWA